MATLSRFKHFLCFVDMKNERYENPKLLIAKSSKESVIININVPCVCENERDAIRSQKLVVWHIKMNFNSNRSLNNGTFSHFKRFCTPYRSRDMKIQIFLSRNRQRIGYHTQDDASLVFVDITYIQFACENLSCLARQNKFHFK